jgi:hypothetical protein
MRPMSWDRRGNGLECSTSESISCLNMLLLKCASPFLNDSVQCFGWFSQYTFHPLVTHLLWISIASGVFPRGFCRHRDKAIWCDANIIMPCYEGELNQSRETCRINGANLRRGSMDCNEGGQLRGSSDGENKKAPTILCMSALSKNLEN